MSLVVGAAGASEWRARTHYDIPDHHLIVPTTQAAVERGAHLAQIRFCAECHAQGLIGRIMVDDAIAGRLAPPNLTSGRAGGALSDDAWERAVRHGTRPDGTPLRIMPAHEFADLSDEDLGAIVAWARRLPASTAQIPPTRAGAAIKLLDLAEQLDLYPASRIDHARPHRAEMTPATTAAYGQYLAVTCSGCHGTGFSGGPTPGAPADWAPAANITPTGIGHYTIDDFGRLLRTGRRPDGTMVRKGMPWEFTRSLDDTEIAALFAYLRTVSPREYGNR